MPSATVGFAPDLDKYLKALRGQPLEAAVEALISLLKRRQIRGSEPCAVATAHILLQVVARSKWQDVDGLIGNVSRVGRRLVEAQPNELVTGNIVRRILSLIRDEAVEDRNEASSETQSEAPPTPVRGEIPVSPLVSASTKQDSASDYLSSSSVAPSRPILPPSSSTLLDLLSASKPSVAKGFSAPLRVSGTSTPLGTPGLTSSQVHALRSEVIDGIEEMKDEINQVDDQIAAVAEVQINPSDYVLVHQPSSTVERFLLRAASRRRFTVLIATGASRMHSEDVQYAAFRKKLSALGISVINIMNCGAMAYMSRVSKVILGARSIDANGAALTDAGAAAIARAAAERKIPVLILAGVYKLSPLTWPEEESLIEWGNSSSFVSFADGRMVNKVEEVRSAVTELIPAQLIQSYITNLGVHAKGAISDMVKDHYKEEDDKLHTEFSIDV